MTIHTIRRWQGGHKVVQALEQRIHELEMELEKEQHHHSESVKALKRQERRLREVGVVAVWLHSWLLWWLDVLNDDWWKWDCMVVDVWMEWVDCRRDECVNQLTNLFIA